MNWKTWTKISGIILFLIAITTFYFNYIQKDEAKLEIQNFPTQLSSLSNEELIFTFFLYNIGDKPAFVDSIVLTYPLLENSPIISDAIISPSEDFSVAGKESQQIQVILPQSFDVVYDLQAEIYYDNTKLSSEIIPVAFGQVLE